MASSNKDGTVRPNALDYSVNLAHLNKVYLVNVAVTVST